MVPECRRGHCTPRVKGHPGHTGTRTPALALKSRALPWGCRGCGWPSSWGVGWPVPSLYGACFPGPAGQGSLRLADASSLAPPAAQLQDLGSHRRAHPWLQLEDDPPGGGGSPTHHAGAYSRPPTCRAARGSGFRGKAPAIFSAFGSKAAVQHCVPASLGPRELPSLAARPGLQVPAGPGGKPVRFPAELSSVQTRACIPRLPGSATSPQSWVSGPSQRLDQAAPRGCKCHRSFLTGSRREKSRALRASCPRPRAATVATAPPRPVPSRSGRDGPVSGKSLSLGSAGPGALRSQPTPRWGQFPNLLRWPRGLLCPPAAGEVGAQRGPTARQVPGKQRVNKDLGPSSSSERIPGGKEEPGRSRRRHSDGAGHPCRLPGSVCWGRWEIVYHTPQDGPSEGGEAGTYPVAPDPVGWGVAPGGDDNTGTFRWEGLGGLPGFRETCDPWGQKDCSAGSGLTQDLASSSTVQHGCAEVGVRDRDTQRAHQIWALGPGQVQASTRWPGKEGDDVDKDLWSYKTPRDLKIHKTLCFSAAAIRSRTPQNRLCREPPAQGSETPRPGLL